MLLMGFAGSGFVSYRAKFLILSAVMLGLR
jgi:hypothetical protein